MKPSNKFLNALRFFLLTSFFAFKASYLFATNIINNGEFSSGQDSWYTYIANDQGAYADVAVIDENMIVSNIVLSSTPYDWQIRLIQGFGSDQISQLEKDSSYVLFFDVVAEKNNRLGSVFIGLDSNLWTPYLYEYFEANQQNTTYYYEFIADTIYPQIKIALRFGHDDGWVKLDNVILQKKTDYFNQKGIVFITDNDYDANQIGFLRTNGIHVTVFYPDSLLSKEPQTTIDWLNSFGLIIVGRSVESIDFADNNKEVWNNLNVPMIVNSPWVVPKNVLNWFNTETAIHENFISDSIYAKIQNENDSVFKYANIIGDSLIWCMNPNDYLLDGSTSNAEIIAFCNDFPLMARWRKRRPLWPKPTTPIPLSLRTAKTVMSVPPQ